MASPAAILSILVKTQGAQTAASQLGGIDKSGRAAAGGMSKAETQARKSGKALSGLGSAAKGAGLLLGAAGLAKGFKTAIDEFQESVKVGGQTEAVLKSTGGAAKVTTKHIQDLAGAISKKSGIDDEAIQSSENMLLTFTKVRNETGKGNKIFDQATQVVTDMSAALGQSGKSSAIQLGKALNDPIKGITALRRVGVSFTADQQKQITTMVKSGDTLGAQKKILKELKTEFGGSAAAQATAADKFKVSLNNVAEAAGAVLVPILNKVMGVLTTFFNQIVQGTGVGGALVSKFKEFGGALAPFGQSIQQIVGWLQKNDGVARVLAIGLGILAGAIIAVNVAMSANPFVVAAVAIAALVVGVVTAYREFTTFRNVVDAVAGFFKSIWPTVSQAAVTAFNAIKTAVQAAWPVIKAVFTAGMNAIAAVVRAIWPVIKGIFTGGFIAIKGIITGAAKILSGAVDVIKGVLHGDFGEIWTGIKKIFSGAFTAIKGIITGAAHALGAAASAVGDAIKGAFTAALGKAAGVVVGFVNGVIDVINKIPGVNIGHVSVPASLQAATGKPPAVAGGGNNFSNRPGMARGGAFGLTGGTVNAPMVMMGEEAPTHPEFVIPTNPAYRKRAQGLLAQAAGAIGFADGGILDKVGGAVSAIAGGAKGLLGKLPGAGSLPSWMKGMGSYVLGKVGSFIKHKVTDILPGGGGGGGASATGLVPQVQRALEWARSHGWSGQVTSGLRSRAKQQYLWDNAAALGLVRGVSVAAPGTSMHERGMAVDVTDVPGFQRAMASAPANSKLIWRGTSDPVHFSTTGHRKGGIIGLAEGGSSPPFLIPGMAEAMPRVMRERAKAARERARKARLKAMREKQHPRWQGQWEQQVNRQGGVIKAFAKGGVSGGRLGLQQLANLWVKAGGKGSISGLMAHVAMAESGGSPTARNASGASGLWQILGQPFKGNVFDPLTNARMAVWKYVHQGLGAWAASRSAWGKYVGKSGLTGKSGAGSTAAGSNAAGGATSNAQKVNPLDQKIANADLAIEQAKRGPVKIGTGAGARKISSAMQQVGALTSKRKLLGARIRSIRKALKGKVSPAKRLALTQELTQRLSEHAQLGTDIAALMAPATTGGDGGSIGDIGGGDVGSLGGGDPNQALIDSNTALQASIDAQVQAEKDHTDALNAAKEELKRQTDFATSVTATSNAQAWKALADILSGQIGGQVAARAMTAGGGVAVRY